MLILYSRMEKFVTLKYGSLTILGERAREFAQMTSCSMWVADWTFRVSFILVNWEESTQAGTPPNAWMGISSCWSACSIMQLPWNRRSIRGSPSGVPSQVTWDGWSDGPWACPHQDPLRVWWCCNIEGCQIGFLGEYVLAPSVLPHQW